MKIALSDLISALSVALDYVEKELIGVAEHHSQRIAYLSYRMGKQFGLCNEECIALAEAAILHDNALKEFVEEESKINELGRAVPRHDEQVMTKHCIAGEQNIERLPFYPLVKGAVLYHHECADGTGAFGKTAEETPLTARIIHIADMTDATWNLSTVNKEKCGEIALWVKENEGKLFDADCANAFLNLCTYETLYPLNGNDSIAIAGNTIRTEPEEVPVRELLPFADIFATIIDYKSRFTCTHSQGIAQKARAMAEYYGWDEETRDKMHIAGALHDVGKLAVDNSILEKPSGLSPDEYEAIQQHAQASYDMLSAIRGFEEVAMWASLHHEKLDGSGYPFGKNADELNHKERLMACIDIYQALREERPYKAGMPHADCMTILRKLAGQHRIDTAIVEDIDRCFA